jgi:RHS repeat-associated protein
LGASVSGSATVTATYNGAEELTSYDNSVANTTTATYNGEGLRTSASSTPSGGSNTTQNFVWNTVAAVPEVLMDSTNAYLYGSGGTPFEQINLSSGTIRYLVADALGSVRGVVSSSGSLTASTSYDAWGNPETTGGLTSYTPIGFAGGYTDPTGSLYLINRYYDPTTGQFISVDPDLVQSSEPYSYGRDNPVSASDPTGMLPSSGGNMNNSQIETLGDEHEQFQLSQYAAEAESDASELLCDTQLADAQLNSDWLATQPLFGPVLQATQKFHNDLEHWQDVLDPLTQNLIQIAGAAYNTYTAYGDYSDSAVALANAQAAYNAAVDSGDAFEAFVAFDTVSAAYIYAGAAAYAFQGSIVDLLQTIAEAILS